MGACWGAHYRAYFPVFLLSILLAGAAQGTVCYVVPVLGDPALVLFDIWGLLTLGSQWPRRLGPRFILPSLPSSLGMSA